MMAQYGAGKNPPWVRDPSGLPPPGVTVVSGIGQPLPGAPTLLNQPGIAAPTVYTFATTQVPQGAPQYSTQQLGLASIQQAAISQLPQPGIAIPTSLATSQVQTVSYPAPRAAVVQGVQGGQPKQRVFTGTVTKLHDSFGFVDEDVFFQTSCVKGAVPKVGDRVLVEASYNANMPFKWNATRIQVLPQQQKAPPPQPPQNMSSGFNTSKPPSHHHNMGNSQFNQPPPPLMSQNPQPASSLRAAIAPPPGSRRMDPPSYDRANRDRGSSRDRRSPPRRKSPPRKRSRSPRRRSRSPARRSSPPRNRRPVRAAPRYMVQVPKISLDTKEASVIALKCRYANMYVPSDFFNCAFSWVDAFPMHRPFELGKQCTYHVMHKEVDPIVRNDDVFEPPDADHLYSAKVMLLASPTIEDLYKKSCNFIEDTTDNRENLQHPTRLVNFLVGLKGKEPMAIGGPWSPSLDGSNPGDDPRVLINTAIRTARALSGIDLSGVTQWYRFAEIRYHRPEEVHKGRVVSARVETVVLFLPDVWSCNPSRIEWDGLAVAYKKQLQERYKEETTDETQEDDEEDGDTTVEVKDPTHHSELDPKSMKVTDLRKELEARSLSSKGLKSQLIARLTKAIKSEVEKEEKEAENKEEEEAEEPAKEPEPPVETDEKDEEKKKREDEDKKRREERERAVRERRYTLPDTPAILVHPSTTAKGGKFDCTMMSLSVLLDYRPDDNKEHTFEVSLFAELFNEMLMRDFGFRIYKALASAPEKPKEEEKKDKKHDKKDEKHKKDEKERDRKDDKDRKDRKDDKEKDKKDDKEKKDKKDDKEKDKKDRKESDSDKKDSAEKKEDKKDSAERKDSTDKKDSPDKRDSPEKKDSTDKKDSPEKKDSVDKKDSADDKKDSKKESGDKEKSDKKDKRDDDNDEPPAKKKKEDDEKDKKKESSSSDKKSDKKKEKDDDKEDGDEEEEDKKSTKSDRESRSSRDNKDRDRERDRDRRHKEKEKEKLKMVTSDHGLLLAFSYFDLSHVGYLLDKDTEEILYTIGLHLSRAQVRKLVSKIVAKDQLQYRKLTDKPMEKEKKEEDKDGSKDKDGKKEDSSPTTPGKEVKDEPMEEGEPEYCDDETLAKGNKPLLPQYNIVKDSPSKRSRSSKKDETVNMVMHKGAMLDIPSMVQRLEKSEKLKRETDTKLKDLQEEMDMLKDSCKSSEQNSQKVALELQELKKRLRDQRKATDRSESDAKKYYEVLATAKSTLGSLMTSIQDVTGDKHSHVDVKKEVNSE